MKLFRRLRRDLARLILRGWVAKWWIQRKTKRLENRFSQELVRLSKNPRPAPVIQPVRIKAPLRQLLFIADVMWEANDLVPELQHICPVAMLDLKPHLRKNADQPLRSAVVFSAAKAFLDENRALQPDLIFLYARP